MFEPIEDDKGEQTGWHAVHHPFTAPTAESLDTFDKDPGSALSNAYDIVLNGTELGGGSIRIHRKDVQERAFDAIGLSQEEAQSQFGFLLEAFNYGPPPHGGIAFGLDRLVALLTGADTIRDVMAFPKTATGGDPLTGAPDADHAGAAQGGRRGRGVRGQEVSRWRAGGKRANRGRAGRDPGPPLLSVAEP